MRHLLHANGRTDVSDLRFVEQTGRQRELVISEIAVKAHRGQVMQKMKANSVADLVKMAGRLRLAERLAKQTA